MMGFWSSLFAPRSAAPRAAFQDAGGGVVINTSQELEEHLRQGNLTAAGIAVTPEKSMTVAAVYGCIRILTGVVANMPTQIKRKVDDRTREDATDHPLWKIFTRKPNSWQTPSQFKRMMQAHLILRGNAYGVIVRSVGRVIAIIPLHPDRVECVQRDDMSLVYIYTRKDGGRVVYPQADIFHLVGLTLDGVHGVSVLTYARETIGSSLAMEEHGSTVFKNGARVSSVLKHPGKLGIEGQEMLRASLDAYRAGGESDGKALILEENMTVERLALTAEDAQWIESRAFTRTDIYMFMGVPPHMLGDTSKQTSFGTGLEQQTQAFVTFSAEDYLTTWEETIGRDLIGDDEPKIYARFNRAALVRGDLKTRWETYVLGRQTKVYSANDVLEMEDRNPIPGGDVYENPMITVTPPAQGGSK